MGFDASIWALMILKIILSLLVGGATIVATLCAMIAFIFITAKDTPFETNSFSSMCPQMICSSCVRHGADVRTLLLERFYVFF